MRVAISSGDRPVYFHTVATTGILMLGKMSVGVRQIANMPSSMITMARTMNVYGRRSASLTIHIGRFSRGDLANDAMALRLALTGAARRERTAPAQAVLDEPAGSRGARELASVRGGRSANPGEASVNRVKSSRCPNHEPTAWAFSVPQIRLWRVFGHTTKAAGAQNYRTPH